MNPINHTELTSYLGNTELLKLHKTAFLCSRKISAESVLKCYEWAIEQREKGTCVMSGFHSPIEKEVLQLLLKGEQPVILVHARGKIKIIPQYLQKPLAENRLLMLFPFPESIKRVTVETAEKRNRFIIELADKVVIGHQSADGTLKGIVDESKKGGAYNLTSKTQGKSKPGDFSKLK